VLAWLFVWSRLFAYGPADATIFQNPNLLSHLHPDWFYWLSVVLETHTHTHPFNDPFSETTRVSRYQKGKTNLAFTVKQETVSGSGISWAICKSAPSSRKITTPAPHHSIFTGRMPFLPPNQHCQSNEGQVLENRPLKGHISISSSSI